MKKRPSRWEHPFAFISGMRSEVFRLSYCFYKKYGTNLLCLLAIILGLLLPLSPLALAGEVASSWGYGGAENPTQWGQLSNDFALCESGKKQSPINIKNAVIGSPAKISFNYQPSPLVILNNGHTIQVNYASGSNMTINGEKYDLLQFHFHTPSEHYINNKAYALELHLVHRNRVGKLAVVGVMLAKGQPHPLIAEIWKNIPATGTTNQLSDRLINATSLLPNNKSYYSYNGSLTTPPCSEDVKWHIFVEPIAVSTEQIATFTKKYQVDARPLQPINDRDLQLHRS